MKTININKLFSFLLLLVISHTTYAQLPDGFDIKKASIKPINHDYNQKNIKNISITEYTLLKKQGKLENSFEYIIENGKTSLVSYANKPLSPASLTPCDTIPY